MPVRYRSLVKDWFPHAQIDFETIYYSVGIRWFVYDPNSGFLLSLGCESAYIAWKVAYLNVEKITAIIAKANTASLLP